MSAVMKTAYLLGQIHPLKGFPLNLKKFIFYSFNIVAAANIFVSAT
jgi:hypothetical protein